MRPVRVGFAGAGEFATTVMAPLVHAIDGVVLQAAAARDEVRARALEPVGRVHASYDDLADDPEVDAVYVSLSNDLHAPVAAAALRAGKHVLCEKPLTLTRAQSAELHAVAAECDRVLLEGYWNRWHPRQRALEHLVATGELGDLTMIDAGFVFERDLTGNFRLEPGRGGGATYDVACYPLSLCAALLGEAEPVAARVEESLLTDEGVDVHCVARVQWPGVEARVTGGMGGPEGRWASVVGTRASAVLVPPAFSNAPEPATALVITSAGGEQRLEFPASDPRGAMLRDFAAVVAGEGDATTLPVTPAHSLAVAQGIDLVRAALAG